MCKNGKWWSKCEKQGVVVKVGAEFEVAMRENGKWWSKWVRNRKWWSRCVQNLKCSSESGDPHLLFFFIKLFTHPHPLVLTTMIGDDMPPPAVPPPPRSGSNNDNDAHSGEA